MAGDATRRGIERAVKVGGFLGLKTSGNPRIMHKPSHRAGEGVLFHDIGDRCRKT